MNPYAVIFDLNGTLVDSETAYYLAYKEVLDRYNVPFSLGQFTDYFSTRGKKLKDYLEDTGRTDLLPNLDALTSEKERIFQSTIVERVTMMDGVQHVLPLLKDHEVPLGLDSSTSRANINQMLSHLGIMDSFNVITAGDMKLDEKYGDVKKKSSRLKYLVDSLGYEPAHCIIVGDAEKDLKGAKDIGMLAIAVPNQYTKNNNFSLADAVYSSLSELTMEVFEEIDKGSN